MKRWDSLRAVLLNARLLVGLALALGLTGCSLGEAAMPNPPTGVPADRSAGVVAPVPPPVRHSLERREECFTCHAIGAVEAPPVPADHEQDVTLCTTCHAVWLAPAIVAAAPPVISHEVEGRADCLVCHKLGTADAPRVPDNHDGLTGDLCQTCHMEVGEIAAVSEGEVSVAEASSIPHGLQGFDACTQCHEEGGPGIPRFPDDHRGRTDDLCTACHSPAEEAPEATSTPEPSAEPTEAQPVAAGDVSNGQVLYAAKCAACHGTEGEGTSIAPEALNDPALLAGLTDEDLATVISIGISGKMPASSELSDQEILDLTALLRSWQ
jgi:mono/diheme cytochrome c family protein